jgi:hypothetical protein
MSDINTEVKTFTVPNMSNKLKDNHNYPEWAAEAEMYLSVMQLKDIVTNTIPCPSDNIGNTIETSQQKWDQASMKAKLLLVNNCEDGPRSRIIMSATASEAWNILRAAYEGRTRTSLYYLHQSVSNLRFDDRNMTIDKHLTEFEKRWSRLTATTQSATDTTIAAGILRLLSQYEEMKIIFLLGTLPPFYNIIIDNITTKGIVTYNDTTIRLRELSTQRQRGKFNNIESPTITPAAFTAQSKDKICNYCK